MRSDALDFASSMLSPPSSANNHPFPAGSRATPLRLRPWASIWSTSVRSKPSSASKG